ncbi:5980_t:CDS:2 [Racocetra persica]|uniref:5980_t:CDS:1 n=1 Tax=Racocetra persica TaxID=160502 RepID=A0ACA9MHP8_9GLOM|nr:5980_t:CDS:2 [Racocetra persica]
MNTDLKNNVKKDETPKIKAVTFKKGMLPEDLHLALGQLRIWAQGNGAKSAFEKVFTLSDLKILVQAFQNESVDIKGKKKSVFVVSSYNSLDYQRSMNNTQSFQFGFSSR